MRDMHAVARQAAPDNEHAVVVVVVVVAWGLRTVPTNLCQRQDGPVQLAGWLLRLDVLKQPHLWAAAAQTRETSAAARILSDARTRHR
jgi:hypothetical protein